MTRPALLLPALLVAGCASVPPPPASGVACAAADRAGAAGLTMTVRRGGASMNVEGPGLETACSNGFGWARCSVSGPVLAVLDTPRGRAAYDIPADQRATFTYAGGQNACVLNREPS